VNVLNDKDCRCDAGQRCGVDHRRQASTPSVRINLGWNDVGIGNTKEVIEQNKILAVGAREPCPHLCTRGRVIQVADPNDRTQHLRCGVERNLAGVRFAIRSEDVHPATSRERRGFADDPALAYAGRPDDADDASLALACLVQDPGERTQFPIAANEGRLDSTCVPVRRDTE
jgi:hypothetical protein